MNRVNWAATIAALFALLSVVLLLSLAPVPCNPINNDCGTDEPQQANFSTENQECLGDNFLFRTFFEFESGEQVHGTECVSGKTFTNQPETNGNFSIAITPGDKDVLVTTGGGEQVVEANGIGVLFSVSPGETLTAVTQD